VVHHLTEKSPSKTQRGGIEMTDKQKNNKQQSHSCCDGIDFAGMMETMMSYEEELCGCGCMEVMKKMAPKSSWPQEQEKEKSE
jgi:hypothetical protein